MLSFDFKEQIQRYIESQITLEELEDWYVPRLRELLMIPESSDAAFVAIIEEARIQLETGVLSEDELRASLAHSIYIDQVLVFNKGEVSSIVASSSSITERGLNFGTPEARTTLETITL